MEQNKETFFLLKESKVIKTCIDEISRASRSIFIITDSTLAKIYGNSLLDLFNHENLYPKLISIPPGETSKSRKMKSFIEDEMVRLKANRKSIILSFGGGVVSDIAGFVAATFMRGIEYYNLPTTLLAMVDASIGGKTGINTPYGKNQIGAVHFPKGVYIEPKFLTSLPKKERESGFMEVIKYGLIWDRKLYDSIRNRSGALHYFLNRSYEIKNEIIKKDPYEKGLRRVLNFGHTVGHALEKISNYSVLHGEAIFLGMVIESKMSHLKGYLSGEELNSILSFLQITESEIKFLLKYDKKDLYEVMRNDKKSDRNKPRFIALTKIGSVCDFQGDYCTEFTKEEFFLALNEIQDQKKQNFRACFCPPI